MNPDKKNRDWNPDWWRYKGIRLNFGIYQAKHVICYKCNCKILVRSISDLKTHLQTRAHKEHCEVFLASSQLPAPKIQFPKVKGFCNKALLEVYECPYVQNFKRKSGALVEKYKREKPVATIDKVRSNFLNITNKQRVKEGKPRLEEMNDEKLLKNIFEQFDSIFKSIYQGKRRDFLKSKPIEFEDILKEDENLMKKSKRSTRSLTNTVVGSASELITSELITDTAELSQIYDSLTQDEIFDEENLLQAFRDHNQSSLCTLGANTKSQYLRSFTQVIKFCHQRKVSFGPVSVSTYIEELFSKKTVKRKTINGMIAAISYFVNKVAKDDYHKTIKLSRVKQEKFVKQDHFDLKYYDNVDGFFNLFKK